MDVDQWLDIHRRHRDGVPIRQIARDTGLSRNTIRRALARDTPPGPRTRRSPGSAIDAYRPRILELLRQDPDMTVAAIGRRIGWARSHTVLKDHVRALRGELGSTGPAADESGLPAELTSFVGRRVELAEVCELLGSARLVTLSGPGGVGKTRLAMRAAHGMRERFPDGTALVPLEALSDPALVAQSLLDALGIADPSRSTGDPLPRLVDHLRGRRTLLVLDNCEHLLEGVAPLLTVLLRSVPELTVLATSRQVLEVPGERLVVVAPLAPPDGVAGEDEFARTLASPAVALFADRAADVLPGFTVHEGNHELVARLCRALEGIPLAIELATVRLRVLSPAELLEHLDHRFAVLTDGGATVPTRQQTLQATIGWSFELCTAQERALWARASVFAGGFDMGAATTVCADERLPAPQILDAVGGLVTKSILVREDHAGAVRFRMLETLREFGQARLAEDQRRAFHARHRDWCSGLVSEFLRRWFGPDQLAWKQRMRREQANLRVALERALVPEGGDPAAAQRMVGLPWFLWATAFSLTEHRHWLHRTLDADPSPTPERAQALATCGFVAAAQGDLDTARTVADEGLAIAEMLDLPETIAFATHIVGLVSQFSGRTEDARGQLGEALVQYRALEIPDHLVTALETHLGMFHLSCGELDEAGVHFRIAHARSVVRDERWSRTFATDGLGYIALASGDLDGAMTAAREGLRLAVDFDDPISLAFAIELVAWVSAARGEPGRAAVLLGASSTLWRSFGQRLYGSRFWQEWRERYVAGVCADLGDAAFDAAHRHGAELRHADMVRLALDPDEGGTAPVPVASSLSRREREIAVLVAEGHSNREIADRLYLSPRTVEGHVSHALEKLGLRRRGQLAAWVDRERRAVVPGER
jgi:predicted ATPase/DNA-binding CsgD family transcriptional regulator